MNQNFTKKYNNLLKETKYLIELDKNRDSLISEFANNMLKERYVIPGEEVQDMFSRVATYYSNDIYHAQRLYDYMSQLWFMPATPILSNGGTKRGLPISCFLNEVSDSLNGIVSTWDENVWLASGGGGIGTYWGEVRSIGERVNGNGQTSGIIPFICVQDSMTLAISQGNLRRGSSAAYLPVWHPEIEEFIEMRRPTGGDISRKALNMHHGIVINDEFMNAVINDTSWELRSPMTLKPIRSLSKARDLWIRILTARLETGEPYILFIDNVNKSLPETYKKLGLKIKTSNLCSEITLATGLDHLNEERTAVCCLSSVNLEFFDIWEKNSDFIIDIMFFLDNVIEDFIQNANQKEYRKAIYSSYRGRDVGLGAMGFHTLLQLKGIPFESQDAKIWNKKIFKHIREKVDIASKEIAKQRGSCPDAQDVGIQERFVHKIAIAPNASISHITGSSASIELLPANIYIIKGLSGSNVVRNKNLIPVLEKYQKNNDDIWTSIINNNGSVQHLDFLSPEEKKIFKTAFEVDQQWVIDLAAERTEYICQSQSLNIFLKADIHKKTLHDIHINAWKNGVKSLYYLRSQSIQQPDRLTIDQKNITSSSNSNNVIKNIKNSNDTNSLVDDIEESELSLKINKNSIIITNNIPKNNMLCNIYNNNYQQTTSNDYDECLLCQ
ncbi:ribonucleoside-diphosphate reductase subunit alpha [Lyticum sinuosum]|uniref:Ribonucleoside-diphosphate reductase n=1 Tax=Lyticum sinuosum TaxID=1332059 RepID=A0AAE5AGS5_9RICK|nr:ribonucleoside-diphosphate reductase subunit alpha [Lyticum sinuosum]MDZ5761132.1 Ribonucleoside-diphosphate reductase subunit alpha [Lyticum sinuosum]